MIAVLVFGHMRWMLPLGVLGLLAGGLAGCPHGPSSTATGTGPTTPLPPGGAAGPDLTESKLDLPSIPARIEVTTSAPTDGTAPDKHSPLLDVLKAENEREMAALGKQKDPAY